MPVRGIRGAVQVARNSKARIFEATQRILKRVVEANRVRLKDVAAVMITMTPDLNAEFPAYAARDMGWTYVPLICAQELGVPRAMRGVIRVLVLVNTRKSQRQMRHQYLGLTASLRPDLAKEDKP